MEFKEIGFEEIFKIIKSSSCSCQEYIENVNWFIERLKKYEA